MCEEDREPQHLALAIPLSEGPRGTLVARLWARTVFRFKDISIKNKLTLIIMGASSVALLLLSGGITSYELTTHREIMTRDLSTLAEVLGSQSTAALVYDDQEVASEIITVLSAKPHIVAAGLYDRNGHLFARYSRTGNSGDLVPEAPEPNGATFTHDHLIVFHDIRLNDEHLGTICLKSDLTELHSRLNRYAGITLLILVASWGVTFLLSAGLRQIITKPVFHLVETAKAVSHDKNYSLRAVKHGNDELGQLIDGFNDMLGQIQQRDAILQDTNGELEKRVQERTRELEAEVEERRRAKEALQEQFTRTRLINEITRAISERQDTDSILRVVLRQLEDHLGLDLGCVAIHDAQADTLNLAASRLKNPLLADRLDLQEGCVMKTAETGLQGCKEGHIVYCPNTLEAPSRLNEHLAGAGLRSSVAVPLMVEGKLFGVLLAARLRADGFNCEEQEFLRMLSHHVALAAHQARLHKALEDAYNELRQSQQAIMQQERLNALGRMASGIAHDINNALSPIVGFTDLVLRGESNLSENSRRHLKHVRTAGEDIAHIVARLRDFYRNRDEHETLQELNVNALIEQVVEMTRPRWRDIPQSKGLTVELDTELSWEVTQLSGIESEVREALTNLVLNAVDALPNGGQITVRSRTICSDTPQAAGMRPYVVIEVGDDGIGMSKETRKRCLEPFFSTKGKRGTGLGLAMVYGVMERHKGRVEVESEPGKGTVFRLIFPACESIHNSGQSDQDEPLEAPLRILYIDDEPLLRELLRELLQHEGHQVEVSDGGESGIETFRRANLQGNPFDAVITDLGMPYVDGRQVAQVVRRESPSTCIVMLTGWGAFMQEEGGPSAPVDCVISKPPRSAELREALRMVKPARVPASVSP